MSGDHAHPLARQVEHLRDRVARGRRALVGVVDHEVAVLPDGHAGVRLHRVVVERGRGVGGVDADLGGGNRSVEVPLRGVGRERGVDLLGRVHVRVVRPQHDVVRLRLVLDAQEALTLTRRLRRLGHHGRHDLPAVGHAVRLEEHQLLVRHVGELGRVGV
jgi:hypothetical protein